MQVTTTVNGAEYTRGVDGVQDHAVSEGQLGVGPAAIWPPGSYLELSAQPGAARLARLHTRAVAGEWGLGELMDTLVLIVSELVTNAVQASQDLFGSRFLGRWAPGQPPVRLRLQFDGSQVLILVWDGSDRMPQAAMPEPDWEMPEADWERGRGLLIVEKLCRRFGTYVLEDSSGKVVWGEVGCQHTGSPTSPLPAGTT